MESAALYAMIFGSDKFDKYVGELQMATMMQQADDEEDVPAALMAFKQTKREVSTDVGPRGLWLSRRGGRGPRPLQPRCRRVC